MLAGAAVLAATGTTAGCSGDDGDGGDAGPAATERIRRRAAEESRGLLRRYDATASAHPALAAALDPLRADVARHVAALGRGLPAGTRAASGGGAGAGPGDRADAEPPPPARKRGGEEVPADPAQALAALAAAEKRTADAHTAALAAAPGEVARLLASVAAAGAAHVYLLGEAG
ncbi:hypothetical protein [Streptomyces sp. MAR4 CNX-425]|uniref:hypothetical protein n=1 Tax=Streptomyces sp. MAR4 CNX-425 TaxID=3406343 RepID=UPI003B5105D4